MFNHSDSLKVGWITPFRTATRSCGRIMSALNFDFFVEHSIHIPDNKLDYYLVLNVKNPYHRLTSLYRLWCVHNKTEPTDFIGWLRNHLHSPNSYRYSVRQFSIIRNLKKKPDFILKVENLSEELLKLDFIKYNFDKVKFEYENNILKNKYDNDTENKNHPALIYTEEMADFVYTHFESEFEYLNYDKNSWNYGTP